MATVFHVCRSCKTAILNDDYSAFDDDDADYPRITAFVESVGMLVDAGTAPRVGYWDCESCGQVEIGNADALETV
ncbi:hypothetical protein SEA_ESTES_172 [Mycobacterium phage Estes]|uniref:Uncharacterized protein n=2 Tax=Reyvirus TaxID=1623301 RepID=A0A7G9A2M1_9CAUD|nr:hypothetical protein J4U03_gp103 [Mycobacterium phage Estes]YP_010014061.1 hypothetical protein J4U04_gp104 [Mycobacterium phage MrMagoo]APQ42256.1 hypothetical protein PBI_MRMAGOO_176 [Mycobacterium phage MrMagoo]QNL30860.1 hypothetical protein SEA_ESTES_172 [Mycobacterium phage Estes]